MKLQCNLCGHKEEVSLVKHINEAHPMGGLLSYQMFFTSAKVVNAKLFTAIKQSVHQGVDDNSVKELKFISPNDRLSIVNSAEAQTLMRSDIVVTEE
ncbi:MAG: hypothetical protein HQK83_10310 [Fibrobacteria bacterium]|nr:hypothetical protein [Fibrobacteria bacterium]